MKITKVEAVTLRHPWGPPENGETRDWLNVLVHCDNGIVGISRGGDKSIIENELTPLLVGQDPRRTALLWQRMYDYIWRFRGPAMSGMASIGAIDIALWDIYGKSCGEPVWSLLGGYRDTVEVYADGIGYVHQPPKDVAALVKKHTDLGFDAVKFHILDDDPDDALEMVALSREGLGSDVKLMLDAFSMWDGRLATELAHKFNPYNLYWLEEPVRKDDEPGFYRMVREASNALIAGGESEGTLYGMRSLIAEGGLQIAQTDILIGGGFTGLLRIASFADAYHVYVAPHGAQYPELNCHLVAAVPNGLMIPACPDIEPYQIWSKLYEPSFKIEMGEIKMTEKPGLGLTFNEDFVAEYRVSA